MLGRVLISRPGAFDVFIDYCIALFFELLGKNFRQRLETDAHHAEPGGHTQGVLLDLVAAVGI